MRFIVTNDRGQTIVLRDQRNGNEVGVYLLEDGIDGWFGTPAPREDPIVRSLTDGDLMPHTITQGSRTVTLHGYGVFGSTIEAGAFIDLVNAMVGCPLSVMCDDGQGRRFMTGYLTDDPTPTLDPSEETVEFTLVITCPDPKKYGLAKTYKPEGGWVTVVNEGNAGTYPKVHVDGPVTMLHIEMGDQAITWNGSAETLDLDFADMQPSNGAIVLDNAFEIPSGRVALAVACDGEVTITVKSAWR